LISRLEEALEAVPAVDAGRVRAVRDAIASGDYQIDPYRIADQILRLERDIDY
jgi:negative regulator of flagellin synthesis FlgM